MRSARAAVALFALAFIPAGVLAQASPPVPSAAAKSELAPNGKLRVGLLMTNLQYVTKDGAPAEMQGAGVEVTRELAKQLGATFEPVRYMTLVALLEGAAKGEWDVAPIGYAVERTKDVDYTAGFVQGASRFLVKASSPIRSVADLDKPGVRVGASERSQQANYIKANLRQAQVATFNNKQPTDVLDHLASGRVDAYLINEGGTLSDIAKKSPDFRMLDSPVTIGVSALAVAKNRPAGVAYAKSFIEYAKTSGLVQQAIERSGFAALRVPSGTGY